MTRDEARKILEDDGYVSYHVWTWGKLWQSCADEYNCCQDDFEDVEETLDRIKGYCGGDWGKVKDAT